MVSPPSFSCYRRRGLQGKLTCNGSGKRSSVIPVVFACSLNLRATIPEPSGATTTPDKDGAWISTKRIFQNFDFHFDFVVKQPSSSKPHDPAVDVPYRRSPDNSRRRSRTDDGLSARGSSLSACSIAQSAHFARALLGTSL